MTEDDEVGGALSIAASATELFLDYAKREGQRAAYELFRRVATDRPTAEDAYLATAGFAYSHTRYHDTGRCLARLYEYTGDELGKAQDR